jgi:hypothetical protein
MPACKGRVPTFIEKNVFLGLIIKENKIPKKTDKAGFPINKITNKQTIKIKAGYCSALKASCLPSIHRY